MLISSGRSPTQAARPLDQGKRTGVEPPEAMRRILRMVAVRVPK